MSAVSSGSYGALIITPDLIPPNPAHWDAQEQEYSAIANTWSGIHEQISQDNALRREAAQSRGFDAAHAAGATLAEEAITISEWAAGVAKSCRGIAGVIRESKSAQDQIVREADASINAAKLPGEREALISQYHAQARMQAGWGVEAAMSHHNSFKASVQNTSAMSFLSRYGDIARTPNIQPVDNHSPGIDDSDPRTRTGKPKGKDKPPLPSDTTNDLPSAQPGIGSRVGNSVGSDKTTTQPGISSVPAAESPSSVAQSASALGGMPRMAGGGGVSSGGGMPGGGGLAGGFGGGGLASNPLAGVGEMPGSVTGLGSAGSVSGGGASATSPAAAFSRGLSAGAGLGGAGPLPSAVSSSTSSPLASGSASSGLVGPATVAPSAGQVVGPAAQSGVLASSGGAVPGSSSSALGSGSGAPMLLPPAGMGPPAAAAPAVAPAVPAGAVANVAGASSASGPGVAAGSPGAATLIPASVVAAGQSAAAVERRESADVAAAKELAWRLQLAAEAVRFPIEWAVGVFRSPTGTETVIVSNDGSCYIPAGVYVPRSVRVLTDDPLVDNSFKKLWFGWFDPARVLVEYAKLREPGGGRFVAAASTSRVDALRAAGVDHAPACTRQSSPLLASGDVSVAALDAMHVHRLALMWPDLYERLVKVMSAAPAYQDRIVRSISAELINASTSQGVQIQGGIPDPIRLAWLSRGGDGEPSAKQWAEYHAASQELNPLVSIFRPGSGGESDPSQTTSDLELYQAHWLVARAAEHLGGWAGRPLPLPDMVYAAAAVNSDNAVREIVEVELSQVEDDLRQV